MPKPRNIEFADGMVVPILYEDRAVLAIDKPAGWMVAPDSWNKTSRNLQLALERSIKAGDLWARARGLRFIRFVHRLDAGTTGILLLVKSPGAIHSYTQLFAGRQMEKRYLAVVHDVPKQQTWKCELPLSRHRRLVGVMKVDPREGRPAETRFRVLASAGDRALVEARPITGRTHQIRVHLAAAGHPILGDELYLRRRQLSQRTGRAAQGAMPRGFSEQAGPLQVPPAVNRFTPRTSSDVEGRASLAPGGFLALRAVFLAYRDPFTGRPVRIVAPFESFVRQFGFAPEAVEGFDRSKRRNSDDSVVT